MEEAFQTQFTQKTLSNMLEPTLSVMESSVKMPQKSREQRSPGYRKLILLDLSQDSSLTPKQLPITDQFTKPLQEPQRTLLRDLSSEFELDKQFLSNSHNFQLF